MPASVSQRIYGHATADATILTSAIVVGGVWLYRKLVEPIASIPGTGSLKGLVGLEAAPAATAQFLPAFAFIYITLGLLSTAAPDAARSFAVLVAVGDVLTNGSSVFTDMQGQAAGTTTAAAPTPTAAATASSSGPAARPPRKVTARSTHGGKPSNITTSSAPNPITTPPLAPL